ncbi:S1 family peptidase [Sphingomonas bacterium]|uniref:S1 family peptidase n=1 Tax=Sphingomonas bacterium TaxID=1895847 RepID=UPI0020C62F06|nr:S1 family peptidase [Sphingomonas bacterium]
MAARVQRFRARSGSTRDAVCVIARHLLTILAAGMLASTAMAQSRPEAMAPDSPAYAAFVGVSAAEADRALRLADASVAVTDALRDTWRERLAGIAVEHRPIWRVVVLLTGDTPVDDEQIPIGDAMLPIVYRTGAAATLAELRTALATRQAAIRAALPHPPGMGIDQRSGELVVIVAQADLDAIGDDALTARIAAIAGVPVRLRSIEQPSLDQAGPDQAGASPAIIAGGRLIGSIPGDPHRYICTAGFAVTDGIGTAVTTAAHCPDALSRIDPAGREHPLAFVGQWGWGYQDVQINAGDEPLVPFFYADTARSVPRPVLGQRAAAAMRAGDLVCHRGERTGYSCATVELTDFAPAGDLCGGACSPSWITVAGPNCGGGDSGSPVFIGSTALGLLKGGSYRADGSCAFYFYMPIEYLPNGWRLLTAAGPQP